VERIKTVYLISILIVSLLIIDVSYTLYWHLGGKKAQKSSTVVEYIPGEKESMISFMILNRETDGYYKYEISIDGKLDSNRTLLINKDHTFKYTKHFWTKDIEGKSINIIIYKIGKTLPMENVTYFVKKRNKSLK
jgi:hypothetical protein